MKRSRIRACCPCIVRFNSPPSFPYLRCTYFLLVLLRLRPPFNDDDVLLSNMFRKLHDDLLGEVDDLLGEVVDDRARILLLSVLIIVSASNGSFGSNIFASFSCFFKTGSISCSARTSSSSSDWARRNSCEDDGDREGEFAFFKIDFFKFFDDILL